MENARLYTLPDNPIEVMVAAGGTESAALAGRIGNGLIGTSPDAELLEAFDAAGGTSKPRYGQLTVCWAERGRCADEWPTSGGRTPHSVDGFEELPLPSHFEQAAAMVSEQDVADAVVCGPDPERHAAAIDAFVEASYSHVYVHQVGTRTGRRFLRLLRGGDPSALCDDTGRGARLSGIDSTFPDEHEPSLPPWRRWALGVPTSVDDAGGEAVERLETRLVVNANHFRPPVWRPRPRVRARRSPQRAPRRARRSQGEDHAGHRPLRRAKSPWAMEKIAPPTKISSPPPSGPR